MTNWTDIDATMPKFIRENPWILTHGGKCCVLDVVMVTDAMYNEITQLRAELAESRASEHGLFGRLETCRQDEAALKAELAAERELADRLAGALEYIDDYCLAYPELESLSAVAASAIEYAETRRNK